MHALVHYTMNYIHVWIGTVTKSGHIILLYDNLQLTVFWLWWTRIYFQLGMVIMKCNLFIYQMILKYLCAVDTLFFVLSKLIYIATINVEIFAGLDFHGFHRLEKYHESFSVNIYKLHIMVLLDIRHQESFLQKPHWVWIHKNSVLWIFSH